ncbi:hypothetical protein [Streptomyces misionensis]|uniref:hypothetical protein n=1 Tax=Streptomyces misionensis TaxID=67331 RepID=UPI003BB2193D
MSERSAPPAGNRPPRGTRTPCPLAVPASATLLIAVHPWDVDGASRAGLRTAWLCRTPRPYPATHRPADVTAASLPELADRLLTWRPPGAPP